MRNTKVFYGTGLEALNEAKKETIARMNQMQTELEQGVEALRSSSLEVTQEMRSSSGVGVLVNIGLAVLAGLLISELVNLFIL